MNGQRDHRDPVITIILMLLITGLSYLTYFHRYDQPRGLFWDENYHIASAQKYLHGVYFAEPHPPLGKLLIAAGEWLLQPNSRSDQFLDTMYGTDSLLPADFSFAGYRFFPALFAWLTAPLLFLIFRLITRDALLSALLSFFYVFDNALIVHGRGAMLEAPLIFFAALAILAYLLVLRRQQQQPFLIGSAALFGLALGAVSSIKLTGMIVALLIPAALFRLRPFWKRGGLFLGAALAVAIPVYVGIWQLHFALGAGINPKLEEAGYFHAQAAARKLLEQGAAGRWSALPTLWREHVFNFTARYQRGVPVLNLCKADENGSPYYLWPVGGRAINYRWHSGENNTVQYLYLQSNPVVWLSALLGLLIAVGFLAARCFFPQGVVLTQGYTLAVFILLYLGYMAVMARLDRVMYLYHYFLPLLLSFILAAAVLTELSVCGSVALTVLRKRLLMLCWGAAVVGGFAAYSPLTYFKPISDAAFKRLALIREWDLLCLGCPRTSNLAEPCGDQAVIKRFKIGEVTANHASQGWGRPHLNATVTNQPIKMGGRPFDYGFGTHANSVIDFRLGRRYSRFRIQGGLPDYLIGQGGSVVFTIVGDGQKLWESPIVRPGAEPVAADVAVVGVNELELLVGDAEDGITHDHACWVSPQLE